MKAFITGICIVLVLGCSVFKSQSGKDVLRGPDLQPFGRTAVSGSELELISSASFFSFRFDSRYCSLVVNLASWQDHNYIQYEMDGAYVKRLRVTRGKTPQLILLDGGTEGQHTVTIYKATEAHTGPIYISAVEGRHIQAVPPSTAPLIEFIGNSITCGAASDLSETPCGKGEYQDQHNAYQAYGPRVARALGVNFLLSSVSGIGIYRNWNSDGPTMPQVYEKTDFQDKGTRYWEFTKYEPRVVSIALGTNDLSNGDGKKPRLPFDSASFVSNYIRFVQQVKAKYPSSQIALLSSPMASGDRRILLQNCLQAVKENTDWLYPSAKPVAVHFFKPMKARGCTGHPSVEDHAILAEELVPFFKALL